jgi:phosphoglycolate phosphatase-like HAD superfamily hydrolase
VEAALEWLEGAGVALAVVSTNCQPAVRTALHRIGVLTRFDVVVARTPELDMANLKPSPFPVELALDRLPCAPGDAVFVGDSVLDMQAGQAAKVYTVGVPSFLVTGAELAAAGAAAVLDSMTGLKGLLGEYIG